MNTGLVANLNKAL